VTRDRDSSRTILIAAGGTGGHIFPALAVMGELNSIYPDLQVTWLGSSHRMEASLIPSRGIDFIGLRQTEIRRKLTPGNILYNIRTLWFLLRSIFLSIGIVRKLRPRLILTTGGFAAGAMGLAAGYTKTPLVIIEPNAYPGLTNRRLGKKASIVFTAYEDAKKYFDPDRTITYGAPARREVIEADRIEARKKLGLDDGTLLVLATGGSQGAAGINRHLPEAIKKLTETGNLQIRIIHQCGKGKKEAVVSELSSGMDQFYEVVEFIEDVPSYLAASDIVISRAGASTLAEIACRGLPAIIIPFPHSSENHQVKNAKAWESSGAAICIEEVDLTPKSLSGSLNKLLTEPDTRLQMGENARRFGNPESASDIARKLMEYLD